MENADVKKTVPHQLILQDRQQVELTGVSDVDSFDETVIVAYTSKGELTIRGSSLHVRRLDLECGVLSVEGKVDTLQYSENRKDIGLFGRLFR